MTGSNRLAPMATSVYSKVRLGLSISQVQVSNFIHSASIFVHVLVSALIQTSVAASLVYFQFLIYKVAGDLDHSHGLVTGDKLVANKVR